MCPLKHSVAVPARTSGSACCSWCNAYRWCSSASRPNRSPASHTASAATNKATPEVQSAVCVTQTEDTGQDIVNTVSHSEFNLDSRLIEVTVSVRWSAGTWTHLDESCSRSQGEIVHQSGSAAIYQQQQGRDSLLLPLSSSCSAEFSSLTSWKTVCTSLSDKQAEQILLLGSTKQD